MPHQHRQRRTPYYTGGAFPEKGGKLEPARARWRGANPGALPRLRAREPPRGGDHALRVHRRCDRPPAHRKVRPQGTLNLVALLRLPLCGPLDCRIGRLARSARFGTLGRIHAKLECKCLPHLGVFDLTGSVINDLQAAAAVSLSVPSLELAPLNAASLDTASLELGSLEAKSLEAAPCRPLPLHTSSPSPPPSLASSHSQSSLPLCTHPHTRTHTHKHKHKHTHAHSHSYSHPHSHSQPQSQSQSQSQFQSQSHSQSRSQEKIDFIEKFTLTGSPVTVFKSDFPGPMPKLMYLDGQTNSNNNTNNSTNTNNNSNNSNNESNSSSNQSIEMDARRATPPTASLREAGEEVRGLVSLEIVAAQNLPREKRMLRVHFQNNPFVVISFGKQSFRTKVIKRTVNPVWKERLFFTVKESEANYYIMFSVYDYDKISYNSCIGMTNIKASTLLSHPNEIQKLALTLRLTKPNGFGDACLLVKGCFISYDVLRKNFWQVLAKQYDHDDNGKLNRIELSTMLESIGSTLSEDTLDAILTKLDVDIDGEIDIANIVTSLEDLTVQASLPEHAEENIALVRTCPICNKGLDEHREDIDIITHLAICAAKDSGKLDRLVMGGFLTEDYASRKWFMKILSFMSFGGYRIGKNNGNILVQDRKTGKLMEEKMPTYIRLGIRWMHQHSAPSRAVDTYMVRQIFQTLTLKQGRKFDDPASVKNIPDFVRYHKINLDEVQEPVSFFKTFNEFFYRKLKPGARKLASPDPRVCVSPADCRINCFENIDDATRLWIKGANFSVANLLKDTSLAEYYKGGSVAVCRLAPQDYHRFHSPVDGRINIYYRIPGTYFTVNPMAVRQNIDVYTENSRTVCLIESDHFGKVALVAIGAMMVGSIVITSVSGNRLSRMDEIGYFAFGGSTIVVLYPPNAITFDTDLLQNSREQLETLVQMGNSIGIAASL